eukprot:m.299689 g.299689  ORF g.299689 m.299689 type:complete len:767 (-) comp16415_c0_seq47:91-2391(-)
MGGTGPEPIRRERGTRLGRTVRDRHRVAYQSSTIIGVKRDTLLKFKCEIVSYNQRNDTPIVTTKDACERIIWPRQLTEAYVRYENVILEQPNVFVCHSWHGNVLELLDTLLNESEEENFFWDVLCLPQPAELVNNENTQLVRFYQFLVEICQRMILIVTPAMNPLVLQREWCLVELQHAARKGLEIHAKVVSETDDFLNVFLSENHEDLNQFIGMLNNFDPKNARVYAGMNPRTRVNLDRQFIVTTFINLILTWAKARIPQRDEISDLLFLCSKAKIQFDTNLDLQGIHGEVFLQLVLWKLGAMTHDMHNINGIIKCYRRVAVTYCEQEYLQEGVSCFGQCYEVLKAVYGEVHERVAIFCNETADFCKAKSMHRTALEYYMMTLTLQQTLFGESCLVAVTCSNISSVHEHLQNFKDVLEFHNKALAIQARAMQGNDHPEVNEEQGNEALRICREREAIRLQVEVPKDAPWCWPRDCEEEFMSVQADDQKFFYIVDVATSPSARATHVCSMIYNSGNRNDKFDMKEVVECVAFRSKDHLVSYNAWVEAQKVTYARIDGNDASSPTHRMYLDWDRENILLKEMINWLDMYPCRLPQSLKPQPHEAPYRSILVFHGLADDLDTIQRICEGGFRTFGARNDGWFGNGVYFTPDLEYSVAYAKNALSAKRRNNPATTAKAVVIACEMVLFNPWPVPDSIVMRGRPITGKSDAHIAVVRHAKDLSRVDAHLTNTIPIPPNTWKTAANPSGEDVSTEIVVNDIHVLPRFYLVF